MAFSKKCQEYLCLCYSILLFISGVVLIIISIYLGYKLYYHFKFVPTECIGPFIVLFLLAFIHIAVTWLATVGARHEHLFHITLFIIFMLTLIVVEISIGIWSMVLWSRVAHKSEVLMINSFEGFVNDNFDKKDWVNLQSQLQCCGIINVNDYSLNKAQSGSIPISCCNSTTTACTAIFPGGCKEPLIKYVKQLMLYISLIGFGSAIFLVLGIIMFSYYYKAIKNVSTLKARRQSRTVEENPLKK